VRMFKMEDSKAMTTPMSTTTTVTPKNSITIKYW
jgi:hypothetical protein